MLIRGDARLIPLADESVQCCVTSPPYWGLRDYGTKGQIGLETTPEAYVATMVQVFREVRRVLRDDGTLWLNLGDTYAAGGHGGGGVFMEMRGKNGSEAWAHRQDKKGWRSAPDGLKAKDLIGIPWRVAFALQADGWWLRSDIIWAKPNPMPESVTDRPTRSHEYLFLLAKSERYFYDADAIKERGSEASIARINQATFYAQNGGAKDYGPDSNRNARQTLTRLADKQRGHSRRHAGFNDCWDLMSHEDQCAMMVNKRDVWTINSEPTPEAHFATFPTALVEPCILAGSKPGDVILDPFIGSGTVGMVAERLGRRWVGLDLSSPYLGIAKNRTAQRGLGL